MDFIVNKPDPLLDAFFDKFNSAWLRPNQVEGFRAYALSLLPEAHRKNIEALSAKIIEQPYQSLHHFLTDAPWDAREVNRRRIEALRADPRTSEHRLREALSLLPPTAFRPVRLPKADGTTRDVFVARLVLKSKKLTGKRRVIIVTTRPDDPAADADLRWLLTNVVQLRDAAVAQTYALRNSRRGLLPRGEGRPGRRAVPGAGPGEHPATLADGLRCV
jgi:hypothetical protein